MVAEPGLPLLPVRAAAGGIPDALPPLGVLRWWPDAALPAGLGCWEALPPPVGLIGDSATESPDAAALPLLLCCWW